MPRILLIEDDVYVREMVRLTLTHFGHKVAAARNGQEGLALFLHTKPDLVITDLVMPVMDGFEVMIELQKLQPDVKIIVISGGGRRSPLDYLQLAKALGATRVLAKPFASERLVATVNELLAEPASEATPTTPLPDGDIAPPLENSA